jgi:hypothetical protein
MSAVVTANHCGFRKHCTSVLPSGSDTPHCHNNAQLYLESVVPECRGQTPLLTGRYM